MSLGQTVPCLKRSKQIYITIIFVIKAKRDEVGIVLGEWHVFAGGDGAWYIQ